MGTLGAVVGGLIGLVMAGFRTAALHRQAKTAERDSIFIEKKHESEAFATAIEQLGHKDFAVRLGAVYALEALAKASENLHGPIFETLCAYVREKAPAPEKGDENAPTKPDVVVQAILTVIGRRNTEHDPKKYQLDLQKTNLRGADLRGVNYKMVNLQNSYLENANLTGANFNNANLRYANLEEAGFWLARLKGANLSKANLANAEMQRAYLQNSTMWGANLEAATLWAANLKGTDFTGANFKSTNFFGATFDETTNVMGANLSGAKYIPASPVNDFRATVKNSEGTIWPDDDDPAAWDRGEDGDED